MAKVKRYPSHRDEDGITAAQFLDGPVRFKAAYVVYWIQRNFRLVQDARRAGSLRAGQAVRSFTSSADILPLRDAILAFPERLLADEVGELSVYLQNNNLGDFSIESGRSLQARLRDRDSYREHLIEKGVRNFRWYDPATLRRMGLSRMIGFMEAWANAHFTRHEMTDANGRLIPVDSGSRETIPSEGRTTAELVDLFPYPLSTDQSIAAIQELNAPVARAGSPPETLVYWLPRDRAAAQAAATRYSKWHEQSAAKLVSRRYFRDENDTSGVTPSQLRKMSRTRQQPYLVHWFLSNYEDPVHSMPYIGSEGGYQYIHGGPYDANDELQGQFSDIVSYESIAEAVATVQEDGTTDWAPKYREPPDDEDFEDRNYDLDTAAEPKLPTPEETADILRDDTLDGLLEQLRSKSSPLLDTRSEQQNRIQLLIAAQRVLAALPVNEPKNPMLGHNNPPPDEEEQKIAEVRDAATTIQEELTNAEPDVVKVAEKASVLKAVGLWFWKKFDKAADSFATKAGESLATAGVWTAVGTTMLGLGYQIMPQIAGAVNAAKTWLAGIL